MVIALRDRSGDDSVLHIRLRPCPPAGGQRGRSFPAGHHAHLLVPHPLCYFLQDRSQGTTSPRLAFHPSGDQDSPLRVVGACDHARDQPGSEAHLGGMFHLCDLSDRSRGSSDLGKVRGQHHVADHLHDHCQLRDKRDHSPVLPISREIRRHPFLRHVVHDLEKGVHSAGHPLALGVHHPEILPSPCRQDPFHQESRVLPLVL